MASAYATVANNGKYIESHTVNYIEVAKDNETIKVDEQLQKKLLIVLVKMFHL